MRLDLKTRFRRGEYLELNRRLDNLLLLSSKSVNGRNSDRKMIMNDVSATPRPAPQRAVIAGAACVEYESGSMLRYVENVAMQAAGYMAWMCSLSEEKFRVKLSKTTITIQRTSVRLTP